MNTHIEIQGKKCYYMEHGLGLIIARLEILEIEVCNILQNPGNNVKRIFLIQSYPGNIGNLIFPIFPYPENIGNIFSMKYIYIYIYIILLNCTIQ